MSLDSKRKTSWQHRRWPLSHVHQEEGPSYRPGHRGAYLSPQGNTDGRSQYCDFTADEQEVS